MSLMRLPFLLLAFYVLCDGGIAQTADESTQLADQDLLRSSPEDVTEEEIVSVSESIDSGMVNDDSGEDGNDRGDAPSSIVDDTDAGAVESDNGVENSDQWLGQEYGVIVAIPPRLSEPPDMDPSDWIPTVNPEFSLDVVQAEDVDEGWAQAIAPNFDEVIKKAVQNIYPLPEPLLAKALALTDDPTAEVTRRLQVEFNQARKRALLADVELRRLSGEQKVFISKLLQDAGATPAKTSDADEASSADVSGSADEDKASSGSVSTADDDKASSGSVGSADLGDKDDKATGPGEESSNSTSAARPSARPGSSASNLASLSTKAASMASKEANGGDDDVDSQVTSEVLQTKGAIEQVNDVLSNINQALGGATTSTVSPPVAIAQGVQNFISGLNLLALQLAKESS